MKSTFLLPILTLLLTGTGSAAWSQQIYRCAGAAGAPPEYINNAKDAQTRNCKTMTGGNVTVVQGTAPAAAVAPRAPVRVAAAMPSGGGPRTDGGPEQRARDSDSRVILESELKKVEGKLAEQQKEYNNGEPEKQGIEGRNYQRYLDRVAEMKDSIARHQSDIAGIKREISRLPSSN
jgi:hypothetical protein